MRNPAESAAPKPVLQNPSEPASQKPVLQKPPGYRDPNTPLTRAVKPRPRKPALPPVYRPPKRKRSGCCCFCCCFLTILILTVLLLLSITGALFYFWFKPRLPIFHLQSLKTPRFNVAVKSDGTYFDSETVVRIQATNPNGKIGFLYGRNQARITVGDDDVDLGSGYVEGFGQGEKNTTMLRFSTRVKKVMIDDDVGKRLKARFLSKELRVYVEVRSRFGVRVGKWKVRKVGIRVLCGKVSLKKLEGGDMPKCRINLLKWINLH
eukprot:TRINITY_DN25871_c0_g1_i1.p1 TRINITY_DN25871_c0_g1~~TRINITY_DN25871_c0_g1_i1.p1  ORF type:complete len:264 (-),score=10.77 TRINITY_DN25871_c0_g1_i1:289-1080(-)